MAPLEWLRRFVAQHRRIIAVALVAFAAYALTQQLRPAPEPGVDVVVTARDIPAGTTLAAADLRVVTIPERLVPAARLPDMEAAVGRTVGFALAENSALQPGMLVSQRATDGRALVPVTLADAGVAAMLEAGSPLTLVSADESGVSIVTGDAVVAARPSEPSGGLVGAGRSSALVLVDVPSDIAGRVAVLGQQGQLSVVLG